MGRNISQTRIKRYKDCAREGTKQKNKQQDNSTFLKTRQREGLCTRRYKQQDNSTFLKTKKITTPINDTIFVKEIHGNVDVVKERKKSLIS